MAGGAVDAGRGVDVPHGGPNPTARMGCAWTWRPTTREDMAATRALADSLTVMLERNGQVVQALRHALAGDNRAIEFLQGSDASAWSTGAEAFSDVDTALLAAGPHETQLRSQVLAEDRFALQRRSERGGAAGTGFRYPRGRTLSDDLDLGIGHLGVDLAAAEGSPIQAVDDGTVLFSTYTVETGTPSCCNTGERVSIYKHCASFLKPKATLWPVEKLGAGGQHGEWTRATPALRVVGQGRAVDPALGWAFSPEAKRRPRKPSRPGTHCAGPEACRHPTTPTLLSQTPRT